jgi:hypothetical protein
MTDTVGIDEREKRKGPKEGSISMRLIGVLLLLFVAIVGIVCVVASQEGIDFDAIAGYTFDAEPCEVGLDATSYMREMSCRSDSIEGLLFWYECEATSQGRDVLIEYNARLYSNRQNALIPFLAIAELSYADRTVNDIWAVTWRTRNRGTLTGRFCGACA